MELKYRHFLLQRERSGQWTGVDHVNTVSPAIIIDRRLLTVKCLHAHVPDFVKQKNWLLEYLYSAVFEKTCATTQKNVKSHVFLDFEKKRKKR